jgi:hypothetical protein
VLADDDTHVYVQALEAALKKQDDAPHFLGNSRLFWAHGCVRGRHVRAGDVGAGIILNRAAIDKARAALEGSSTKYGECADGSARLALALDDVGIAGQCLCNLGIVWHAPAGAASLVILARHCSRKGTRAFSRFDFDAVSRPWSL